MRRTETAVFKGSREYAKTIIRLDADELEEAVLEHLQRQGEGCIPEEAQIVYHNNKLLQERAGAAVITWYERMGE